MARRKKRTSTEIDLGLKEYGGWERDQEAWFPVRDTATPHQGRIYRFHPEDRIAPCASVIDREGGYKVLPVIFLFHTKKEAKAARADYLEFWQNIRENEE